MEMALGHIGTDTPIHLSFDVDALDLVWRLHRDAGSRRPDARRATYVQCVHETGNLVAVDLVEVNPSLALNDSGAKETVRAGCSLVRCAWARLALKATKLQGTPRAERNNFYR